MVKIVELTREELNLRAKTSKLVEITREVLGVKSSQKVSVSAGGNICISHHSSEALGNPIYIAPEVNRIVVEFENYFEQARSLAEAYEKVFGRDSFTVKKLYH